MHHTQHERSLCVLNKLPSRKLSGPYVASSSCWYRLNAMIRCTMLIAACAVLHGTDVSLLPFGSSIPLSDFHAETILWYLEWCFAVWACIDFNSVLNGWAENRWVWRNDTSAWDWKKEIAVITGGSKGIGACVVKKLVSHGISCAVLDVAPLSETFTKGGCLTQIYAKITES
jgi:all-trans-retinol dehydrogenase (NAD+)